MPKKEKPTLKVIIVGDSCVGKSKLIERFLEDDFKHKGKSTFALDFYEYDTKEQGVNIKVGFWDTAGQEKFQKVHRTYYAEAHACLLVFDVTRKETYKHLDMWYRAMRAIRPEIPCLLIANKIDANEEAVKVKYAFAEKRDIPIMYTSAATGVNVVKMFKWGISEGYKYYLNPSEDDKSTKILKDLASKDDGEIEKETEEIKNKKML